MLLVHKRISILAIFALVAILMGGLGFLEHPIERASSSLIERDIDGEPEGSLAAEVIGEAMVYSSVS
jgi:hypothetical protein